MPEHLDQAPAVLTAESLANGEARGHHRRQQKRRESIIAVLSRRPVSYRGKTLARRGFCYNVKH